MANQDCNYGTIAIEDYSADDESSGDEFPAEDERPKVFNSSGDEYFSSDELTGDELPEVIIAGYDAGGTAVDEHVPELVTGAVADPGPVAAGIAVDADRAATPDQVYDPTTTDTSGGSSEDEGDADAPAPRVLGQEVCFMGPVADAEPVPEPVAAAAAAAAEVVAVVAVGATDEDHDDDDESEDEPMEEDDVPLDKLCLFQMHQDLGAIDPSNMIDQRLRRRKRQRQEPVRFGVGATPKELEAALGDACDEEYNDFDGGPSHELTAHLPLSKIRALAVQDRERADQLELQCQAERYALKHARRDDLKGDNEPEDGEKTLTSRTMKKDMADFQAEARRLHKKARKE